MGRNRPKAGVGSVQAATYNVFNPSEGTTVTGTVEPARYTEQYKTEKNFMDGYTATLSNGLVVNVFPLKEGFRRDRMGISVTLDGNEIDGTMALPVPQPLTELSLKRDAIQAANEWLAKKGYMQENPTPIVPKQPTVIQQKERELTNLRFQMDRLGKQIMRANAARRPALQRKYDRLDVSARQIFGEIQQLKQEK